MKAQVDMSFLAQLAWDSWWRNASIADRQLITKDQLEAPWPPTRPSDDEILAVLRITLPYVVTRRCYRRLNGRALYATVLGKMGQDGYELIDDVHDALRDVAWIAAKKHPFPRSSLGTTIVPKLELRITPHIRPMPPWFCRVGKGVHWVPRTPRPKPGTQPELLTIVGHSA